MKKLNKTEYVKRWLQSGKALRQHQAKVNWNLERLAPIIARLKERGMWIINIGKPGKHAKYIMLEKGPIKNLMILGHRLEILEAIYLPVLGSSIKDYSDMDIFIQAYDGIGFNSFWCDSSAFRDEQIMKNHIKQFAK